MATARAKDSFDPHGIKTWADLSKEERQEFFDNDIASLKGEMKIRGLIRDYNLQGLTPLDIHFYHTLEEDILAKHAKTEIDEEEKEEHHEKKHTKHAAHPSHVGHHEAFKPSWHEVYTADKKYLEIHAEEEGTKFEEEYKKQNKKPPTPQEIDAHVNHIAEAKFKEAHPQNAKDLEQKERIETRASSYEEDTIAKQYLQKAHEESLEARKALLEKLHKNKISDEQYREQALKAHQEINDHYDMKFAKEFPEKATHYAAKNKDPRVLKAIETIRKGQSTKNAKAKRATSPYYTTKTVTPNKIKEIKSTSYHPPHRYGILDPEDLKKAGISNIDDKNKNETNHSTPPSEFSDSHWSEPQAIYPQIPNPIDVPPIQISMPSPHDNDYEPPNSKIPNIGKLAQTINRIRKAAQLVSKAAEAIGTSEIWLPILGILLVILIIVVLVILLNKNSTQDAQNTPIPGLTITVTGPPTVSSRGVIKYQAVVACNDTCQQQGTIEIYVDTLPTGMRPDTDTTQKYTQFATTPHLMTWTLPQKTATYTINFGVVTTTINDNTKIGMVVKGDVVAGSSNSSGSNASPTTNDCGKTEYSYYMGLLPDHKNFGDPGCTLKNNNTVALKINQFESNPDRQKCFFFVLANHESSYNPNAYNGNSTSGNGAYGMFQMNPKSAGGASGWDVGDVPWDGSPSQEEYAVKRNQLIGNTFAYWEAKKYDSNGWCHP